MDSNDTKFMPLAPLSSLFEKAVYTAKHPKTQCDLDLKTPAMTTLPCNY